MVRSRAVVSTRIVTRSACRASGAVHRSTTIATMAASTFTVAWALILERFHTLLRPSSRLHAGGQQILDVEVLMFRMSRFMVAAIAAVAVLASSPCAWARQLPVPQPPAEVPPVEIVASVTWREVPATAGALKHWTGPGFSLGVNGNLTENVAIATSVEKI